jgi:hypothetical protein
MRTDTQGVVCLATSRPSEKARGATARAAQAKSTNLDQDRARLKGESAATKAKCNIKA